MTAIDPATWRAHHLSTTGYALQVAGSAQGNKHVSYRSPNGFTVGAIWGVVGVLFESRAPVTLA